MKRVASLVKGRYLEIVDLTCRCLGDRRSRGECDDSMS